MMKKGFAYLLCLALVFAVCCAGAEHTGHKDPGAEKEQKEVNAESIRTDLGVIAANLAGTDEAALELYGSLVSDISAEWAKTYDDPD